VYLNVITLMCAYMRVYY